jgi:hypothetical protein
VCFGTVLLPSSDCVGAALRVAYIIREGVVVMDF